MNNLFDNRNIFVALTYNCNAFCKKCMTRYHINRNIDMTPQLIDAIVDKLRFHQYAGIISVGSGEPLLFPHLAYFFSSILSINSNISLRILSNGLRFNCDLPEEYFNLHCKWGITMDGFTQESLSGFQSGIPIEQVKLNVKGVVEKYGPDCLYLNYTLHNKNYNELVDFCTFAAELGIHDIYVTELKVYEGYENRLQNYFLRHTSDVDASIACAREILSKHGISDKGLQIDTAFWRDRCFLRQKASPIIDVDGSVSFCSGREDVIIGNILDSNIEDRWSNMYNILSSQSQQWCSFCHARQLKNGLYTLPKTINWKRCECRND